jgi:hypothetical protein
MPGIEQGGQFHRDSSNAATLGLSQEERRLTAEWRRRRRVVVVSLTMAGVGIAAAQLDAPVALAAITFATGLTGSVYNASKRDSVDKRIERLRREQYELTLLRQTPEADNFPPGKDIDSMTPKEFDAALARMERNLGITDDPKKSQQ